MTLFSSDGNRKQLENQARSEGRLPPGQSLTLKWPVLHYASVPRFDESTWDFKISGEVAAPADLSWKEFLALPQAEVTSDFHCVTRWSRLDNRWTGVRFNEVLKLVQPTSAAKHVLVLAEEGYTSNIPLVDLMAACARLRYPTAHRRLSVLRVGSPSVHWSLPHPCSGGRGQYGCRP